MERTAIELVGYVGVCLDCGESALSTTFARIHNRLAHSQGHGHRTLLNGITNTYASTDLPSCESIRDRARNVASEASRMAVLPLWDATTVLGGDPSAFGIYGAQEWCCHLPMITTGRYPFTRTFCSQCGSHA